ncbi:UvrD-helicase domain-containing protein [Litoribacter ruber]|uniref:UvrD-helicase domain-containing protein n=1 Tax=Litoribacter ruber TaxID=702568 RepID=UPI001BDA4F11|nr:UvrD-helicase domain-containing protein [Litoribacter ruber]MBT0812643.1 UvrD-helicase domain-containing protein [Litoribacter ruber]
MSEKPFIIYKSSAGSGKTYTLTKEYLKLALAQPYAFKSILAVTFTNKATQEMKERILEVLSRMKREIRPKEDLDATLLAHFQITPLELQDRARQTLLAILHDYGSFSVSTIDSFFQKVVRSFAREIDLQAKFDVELDQDAVLSRVVDRIITKVMDDELLHKWLVDYAQEQVQEGKSWDIRKGIQGLGKQLFQEGFKQYQGDIKRFLADPQNVQDLKSFIQQQRKKLLDYCCELKEEATRIRTEYGLEWTDYSGGGRSFAKRFEDLGAKPCPVPALTDAQMKMVDNPEGWATKTSKNKDLIEASFHAGLGRIISEFGTLTRSWNTLEAVRKNFYVYGIFKNLLDELIELKNDENILLISDANDFLKEITKENDAPFIYEKVGNQYQHFLIDEFQDTSGFQWESFKPLLENSLAENKTNLLVGDVKQSIYRWRGGELRLLLEEVERQIGEEKIRVENLETNYRSLPNIINFNNTVFTQLNKLLQGTLSEKYGEEAAGILAKAYADVEQKVSDRKSAAAFKGKVRMEFIQEDKDAEEGGCEAQMLQKLPQVVMELQDRGYALKDIAFLVRRKSEGERIVHTMMQAAEDFSDYRFDVLSDEAMYLGQASSVKALVAGMKYIFDTGDRVSYTSMWYFRGVIFGESVSHELFSITELPATLEEKAKQLADRIPQFLQMPLSEMLEELIQILDLAKAGKEKAYISGFKEAVFDYVGKNRADLAGFLEWWEENQQKRTVKIPENHDAMRILTIHKSKGLQYKVVLMPYLDWTIFDTTKDNILWSPFELEGLPSTIIPLSLKKELANSAFEQVYASEEIMAYLDTLNMVYVALTRAEEVFWSFTAYKDTSKSKSLNALGINLQLLLEQCNSVNAAVNLPTYFDGESKVFEFGEWGEKIISPTIKTVPTDLRWDYTPWQELLKVRELDQNLEGSDVLDQKRKYGLLIHRLLEHSKTREEANQWVDSFMFEGEITQDEKVILQKQLEVLFEQELFRSWFGGNGVLLAEQGIILPGGEQKRPDRVILRENLAVIVDFKTGEEKKYYKNQVQDYMELVSEITKLPAKGYLCYLESGRIVEVSLVGKQGQLFN